MARRWGLWPLYRSSPKTRREEEDESKLMNGTKVWWGPVVPVEGPTNSNSRKQKLAAHGLALAWPAAAYSDEELVDGP